MIGAPALVVSMTVGNVATSVVALCLVAAGISLAVACLWWRFGRSPSARWWVRTTPIPLLRTFPPFEGVVLVLLPVTAETVIALGVLVWVAPAVAATQGWALVLLVVAVLGQGAIWLVARGITAYRRVLPLWVYPGWLRETRRSEQAAMAGADG